jgi:hypothetical protein
VARSLGKLSAVDSKPASAGRFITGHGERYFFSLARPSFGSQALSFRR